MISPPHSRTRAFLWTALSFLALLVTWSLAVRVSHTQVFPSPVAVLRGAGELLQSGRLTRYVAASLARVGLGFAGAVLLGMPLGLCLGIYRGFADAVDPLMQVLRPISPLAWAPVAVVLFGVGNTSTVVLIFFASFFPMAMATSNAVRQVPALYIRASRNFGLSGRALLWRVLLPASLPHLLIGMRVSLGVGWLVVVAAEMLGVDSGLGYLIMDARNAGKRYDLVVAGMVLIGVIGLALDGALRSIERCKVVRWAYNQSS